MAGRMVRIDDELHADYAEESKETGIPIARIVDRQLRRAKAIDSVAERLGVIDEMAPPPSPERIKQVFRSGESWSTEAAGPLTAEQPESAKAKVVDEPCKHPIGRRIADMCAVCGADVKGGRR